VRRSWGADADAGLLDGGVYRADRGAAGTHGAGAVGVSRVESLGNDGAAGDWAATMGAEGGRVVSEGGAVGAAWGAVCAAPKGGSGDAVDNCEGWEAHAYVQEEGGGVGGSARIN